MSIDSNLLVELQWLEDRLRDPSVRVIDCSVDIEPRPPGPSNYISRASQYRDSHIPGAAYLHMVDDLSDPHGAFPFAMPPPDVVWRQLSSLGISATDTIVLYGGSVHWAVHRCWWVLKVAGARDVRLLNASFEAWIEQDRPVETGAPGFSPSEFSGEPLKHWVADKDDVIASLDDPAVALVNSLSADQFAGRGQPFGRSGRIPGSISVPAATLINRRTGTFCTTSEIEDAFEGAGASSYDRLITYCGGGIAASTTFFALTLLGYDKVSLYDGSLLEWSADPDLPLVVD